MPGILKTIGGDDVGFLLGLGLQLFALLEHEGVHRFLHEGLALGVALDGVEQEGVLHEKDGQINLVSRTVVAFIMKTVKTVKTVKALPLSKVIRSWLKGVKFTLWMMKTVLFM